MTFSIAFGCFFLFAAFAVLAARMVQVRRRKVAYARSRANHPAGRGR